MTQLQERLFVLEASDGGLFSVSPDGSDKKVIVTGCRDGSIERVDLIGNNPTSLVPPGVTFTPKQLHFETVGRKLYRGDREGMRVMRCDIDGSNVETLIETGQGEDDRPDETRWCVGVAVDPSSGHLYWTQKGPSDAGLGKILRAGIDVPAGETAVDRSDIEVLFTGLPEPIDLELDLSARMLYWTDRGDAPRGNTVNRAPMDAAIGWREPEIPLHVLQRQGPGRGAGAKLLVRRRSH